MKTGIYSYQSLFLFFFVLALILLRKRQCDRDLVSVRNVNKKNNVRKSHTPRTLSYNLSCKLFYSVHVADQIKNFV